MTQFVFFIFYLGCHGPPPSDFGSSRFPFSFWCPERAKAFLDNVDRVSLSTLPSQFQRLLVIIVAMSSCWQLLKRSWFDIVLGQYVFLGLGSFLETLYEVSTAYLGILYHSPALWSIQNNRWNAAFVGLILSCRWFYLICNLKCCSHIIK